MIMIIIIIVITAFDCRLQNMRESCSNGYIGCVCVYVRLCQYKCVFMSKCVCFFSLIIFSLAHCDDTDNDGDDDDDHDVGRLPQIMYTYTYKYCISILADARREKENILITFFAAKQIKTQAKSVRLYIHTARERETHFRREKWEKTVRFKWEKTEILCIWIR